MWQLRGSVVHDLETGENHVVFYAIDLLKWLREQNNQTLANAADWLDVSALDIIEKCRDCGKL